MESKSAENETTHYANYTANNSWRDFAGGPFFIPRLDNTNIICIAAAVVELNEGKTVNCYSLIGTAFLGLMAGQMGIDMPALKQASEVWEGIIEPVIRLTQNGPLRWHDDNAQYVHYPDPTNAGIRYELINTKGLDVNTMMPTFWRRDCWEFAIKHTAEWEKDTTRREVLCFNRGIVVKAFAESVFPQLDIKARALLSANISLVEAVANVLCIGDSGLSGHPDVYDKIAAVLATGSAKITVNALNRSYNNGCESEICVQPSAYSTLLLSAEEHALQGSAVPGILLTSDQKSLAIRRRWKPFALSAYILTMFALTGVASLPGDDAWHEKMYAFLQLFFTIAISLTVGVLGLVQEYDRFLNICLGLARIDDLVELDCNPCDLIYTIQINPRLARALVDFNTCWKIWQGGGRTTSSLVVHLNQCTLLRLTIDRKGEVALRSEHPGQANDVQYHKISYNGGIIHVEEPLAEFQPLLTFTSRARIGMTPKHCLSKCM